MRLRLLKELLLLCDEKKKISFADQTLIRTKWVFMLTMNKLITAEIIKKSGFEYSLTPYDGARFLDKIKIIDDGE